MWEDSRPQGPLNGAPQRHQEDRHADGSNKVFGTFWDAFWPRKLGIKHLVIDESRCILGPVPAPSFSHSETYAVLTRMDRLYRNLTFEKCRIACDTSFLDGGEGFILSHQSPLSTSQIRSSCSIIFTLLILNPISIPIYHLSNPRRIHIHELNQPKCLL